MAHFSTPSARLLRSLVDQLRHMPMPWPQMPEGLQQTHIDRMAAEVDTALIEAVREVCAGGFTHFPVKIKQLTVTDDSKLILNFDSSENIEAIVAHVGRAAILVLAPDAESYIGGTDSVRADPDQPSLLTGDDEGQGDGDGEEI